MCQSRPIPVILRRINGWVTMNSNHGAVHTNPRGLPQQSAPASCVLNVGYSPQVKDREAAGVRVAIDRDGISVGSTTSVPPLPC